MATKKASLTVCQKCYTKASIVFLTDHDEPVFTPSFHKDQVVCSIIATKELPYPEVSSFITGKALWLCPSCLGAILVKP